MKIAGANTTSIMINHTSNGDNPKIDSPTRNSIKPNFSPKNKKKHNIRRNIPVNPIIYITSFDFFSIIFSQISLFCRI